MFNDRSDAARQLVTALQRFKGTHPLVLAIPRGAVPMAKHVAEALEGDLDVVLVRKLTSPASEELAVGAIDEDGWSYVADFAASVGADPAYLEREKHRQLALLAKRRALYTPWRGSFDPAGRVAIVIDDGLATGATMIAALHSIRAHAPRLLVCAVPVASPEALRKIAPLADEVVCLDAPEWFTSVGGAYRRFDPVSGDEVATILRQASMARERASAAARMRLDAEAATDS